MNFSCLKFTHWFLATLLHTSEAKFPEKLSRPLTTIWGISGIPWTTLFRWYFPDFPLSQFNFCHFLFLLLLKNDLFNQNCLLYGIFGHNILTFFAMKLFLKAVVFFDFVFSPKISKLTSSNCPQIFSKRCPCSWSFSKLWGWGQEFFWFGDT